METRHTERPAAHCWKVTELSESETPCGNSDSPWQALMFQGHYHHPFIAHCHDAVSVVHITSGRLEIEVDQQTYSARAGQLLLIGTNQIHAARPVDKEGWGMRQLHLPCTFFHGMAPAVPLEDVNFAAPLYTAQSSDLTFFEEWHKACQQQRPTTEVVELFCRFEGWLRHHFAEFAPYVVPKEQVDPRLSEARRLLSLHVFEHRTLEEIASQVGMSNSELIRRYTKTYAITPHGWRMQARVRAAAELILANENLVEVADVCGFTDQSHLNRVFKRVYGVTPGQYRLMH